MVAKTAKSAPRAVGGGKSAALLAVMLVLAVVGGCRTQPETGVSPPDPASAPAHPEPTATTEPEPATVSSSGVATGSARYGVVPWPIDPQQSVVTIIVRRTGPLARLGHDHVITSADETGTVWAGATPAASAFELQLPVERFEVDLVEARERAGAEFSAPVPDEARAGTRRNMLRPEVLDAASHPIITLRSIAANGDWPQPVIRIAVQLRGVTREHDIPVLIERSASTLLARGELRLNQSDYGITPFSVAGGAIQVADTLEIRFELAASAP
jgi:YceI-like domain